MRWKGEGKKKLIGKLVRYGLIGGVSTIIHFATAYAYLYFIAPSLMASNIVGFLTAYLFSYVMQSIHVFGHNLSWAKAWRYFIVQLGSLLVSIVVSDHLGGYSPYIKTIFVIVLMPLITFSIHSVWTFAKEKVEE